MRTSSKGGMTAVVVGAMLMVLAGAAAAPAEELAAINGMLMQSYDAMHTALAADSMDGVKSAALAIATQATAAAAKAKDAAPYKALSDAATATAGADEMEALRESFKGLSKAMAKLVESGQLTGAELYYCPMFDGYWLQKSGDSALRNPYYGKSMLRCGEKVAKVEES